MDAGLGLRAYRWLNTARAREEEDRRRELALNWILLVSVGLALFEAAQRLPAVLGGGAGAADHGPTFVLACVAGAMFSALLALSRRGRQVLAAWGLLGAYYVLAAWLFVAEGTEEPAAVVLCGMLVVAGGVLLGTRVSMAGVLLITATLIAVGAMESSGVLTVKGVAAPPTVFEQLGIGGGLGAIALMLSARTGDRRGSVGELLSGVSGTDGNPPVAHDVHLGMLTVRELQVVRLVAAGHANADIARELFISPRTVHAHVSNALRKTNCANRTELAVLAVRGEVGTRSLPATSAAGIAPAPQA